MIERPFSARFTTKVRGIPLEQAAPAAPPQRRSRHSAIINDLYTYQRYKTWMHDLRHGWINK
jgi:hypothetical protein